MKFVGYELPSRFIQHNGLILRGVCCLMGALNLFGLASMATPALAIQPSGNAGSMLQYSGSGVNFGNVVVDGLGTQQVTVTNSGRSKVSVTNCQVSGLPFSVTGLDLPVYLKPGQSFSFTADFAPTSTGTFNGSMTFTSSSNGSNSQESTESLTGTGVPTTLTLALTPTSLSFGNVTIGGDAQLPVQIQNTGTGIVTISSATVTGTGYTLSNLSLPLTLTAGQSTSFTVTFAPTSSGTFNGTASLTSNATTSPNIESLSGTGVTSSSHYVSLSWTASTSQGILGYDVYRGTTSGGPYSEIGTVTGTGTTYTDNTVLSGDTYYYVVTTVAGSGQSNYSNQATASVP
jgi:Abnormal spindle-like microcephaly-assoc'd, ASPM-SPD-2-Hydin